MIVSCDVRSTMHSLSGMIVSCDVRSTIHSCDWLADDLTIGSTLRAYVYVYACAASCLSQICLQQWIDEKQKMASSVVVSCPQCQFPYQVKYPSTNLFLLVYEYMERGISFCSPMILAGVTATALYWCSLTYGMTSAVLAMGKEQSLEYFGRSNESSLVVVLLPILPWMIFTIKFSRPEVLILKAWYRFLAPFLALALKPFSVGTYNYFPRERYFSSSQINVIHHLSRCVLSTVFLPVIASSVGQLLFSPVKGNVKKTLLVRECTSFFKFC